MRVWIYLLRVMHICERQVYVYIYYIYIYIFNIDYPTVRSSRRLIVCRSCSIACVYVYFSHILYFIFFVSSTTVSEGKCHVVWLCAASLDSKGWYHFLLSNGQSNIRLEYNIHRLIILAHIVRHLSEYNCLIE
jgi:hypothetical protein